MGPREEDPNVRPLHKVQVKSFDCRESADEMNLNRHFFSVRDGFHSSCSQNSNRANTLRNKGVPHSGRIPPNRAAQLRHNERGMGEEILQGFRPESQVCKSHHSCISGENAHENLLDLVQTRDGTICDESLPDGACFNRSAFVSSPSVYPPASTTLAMISQNSGKDNSESADCCHAFLLAAPIVEVLLCHHSPLSFYKNCVVRKETNEDRSTVVPDVSEDSSSVPCHRRVCSRLTTHDLPRVPGVSSLLLSIRFIVVLKSVVRRCPFRLKLSLDQGGPFKPPLHPPPPPQSGFPLRQLPPPCRW